MGVVPFALGFAVLGAALYAAGVCGLAVRRRLMPEWSGAIARLSEGVIAIAVLLWIAELLGVAGLFRPLPFLAALAITAFALRRKLDPGPRATPRRAIPSAPTAAAIISFVIAALVVVHWSVGTQDALHTGIVGYDSNWYHLPLSAHFVQSGSTLGYPAIHPRYEAWFYPANSELLNAVAILPFHRDFLVPLANMGWLLGTLAAAWCVGRPFGKGPWTLVAAALVLDSGVLADQAGEARNDTLGLFLILAGIAFLLNARESRADGGAAPGAIGMAGLAVGLAAGVKLTMIAPAAGIALAVILSAGRGRRLRDAATLCLPALAGGGFWFARNIGASGNPLPWYRTLGPIHLDGPDQALGGRRPASILHYLSDGHVLHHWFVPGLVDRLGHLWLPFALLALTGLVGALLTRGDRFLRVAAVAGLLAIPLYLVDGTSAEGPPGMPIGFVSSLRHVAPSLLIGMVLLPLVPFLREERRAWVLLAVFAALLPFVDASGHSWGASAIVPAAVVIAGLAAARWWSGRRPTISWWAPAVGAVAISAVLIWPLQESYLDGRYGEGSFRSPGLQAAFEKLGGMHDQRIATTLPLQYPLYGADLSNSVSYLGVAGEDAAFRRVRNCVEFRRALRRGSFRFLLSGVGTGPGPSTLAAWVGAPRAKLILRDRHIAVYRFSDPPDPSGCRGLVGRRRRQGAAPRAGQH